MVEVCEKRANLPRRGSSPYSINGRRSERIVALPSAARLSDSPLSLLPVFVFVDLVVEEA